MGQKEWTTGWGDLTNVEARTDEARRSVVETRRQAYSRDVNCQGVALCDDFDSAPNTLSYILLKGQVPRGDSRAMGSVRVSMRGLEQDPVSTPCSRIFASELQRLFADSRFVEVSRLAICPSSYDDGFRLYLAIMQNGIRVAEENKCDFILAPTVIEHVRLYRGMGFEQVAEARQYYGGMVCCLLALDWRAQGAVLRNHKRFHRLFADWNARELAA